MCLAPSIHLLLISSYPSHSTAGMSLACAQAFRAPLCVRLSPHLPSTRQTSLCAPGTPCDRKRCGSEPCARCLSTAGKNPCVRQSIAGKGSVRISRALRAWLCVRLPLTMAASVRTVGWTEPCVRSSSAGLKIPARAQTLRAKALRAIQKNTPQNSREAEFIGVLSGEKIVREKPRKAKSGGGPYSHAPPSHSPR